MSVTLDRYGNRTDIKSRFVNDIKGFELTTHLDQGVHRHLSFRRPIGQGSAYWFDLITWPGALTFRGDMGCWTWARLHDMFEFFRDPVNLSYWTEKVIAGEAKRYDADTFRSDVEGLREYLETDEERAEFDEALASDAVECGPAAIAQQAINLERRNGYQSWPVFSDLWEYDGQGYIYHYEWALHAVVWGIQRYRSGDPQ